MENLRERLLKLADTSELSLANKKVTVTYAVFNGIIAFAYIMEAIKGSRTWGYTAIILALTIIPIIATIVMYNRDNESKIIKYVVAACFAALYAVVLFTGANDLIFAYAFPMLIITALYLDQKYLTVLGSGIVLFNIINVVWKILYDNAAERMPEMEIQALATLLIVIYLIVNVNVSLQYQKTREARLVIEKDRTTEMLNRILGVSSDMTDNIDHVVNEMTSLSDSVEATLIAMSEVQAGAQEAATSVQDQLLQTEEITTHAAEVENVAGVISENLASTVEAVRVGRECMDEMTRITADAIKSSEQVSEALNSFKNTTSQMNQITDLINSVAKQTSLLALNASIEAARAGDAGRGFAVVATEISQLAGQTSTATDNIVTLINDITNELGGMIDSVNTLIAENEQQTQATAKAGESFETIVTSVDEISDQSNLLVKSVKDLAGANQVIIESITTISAIVEEVSAHSNQTYDSSQANQQIVKEVEHIVDSLNSNAKVLKNATE